MAGAAYWSDTPSQQGVTPARVPEISEAKATRVMQLMEKGEVDGNHWEEGCKHLSGNLKAEAMRSCLGQLASSSRNFSALTDCADARVFEEEEMLFIGIQMEDQV